MLMSVDILCVRWRGMWEGVFIVFVYYLSLQLGEFVYFDDDKIL